MQDSVSNGGWYNIQPAGVSVFSSGTTIPFHVDTLKLSFTTQLLIFNICLFAANVQIVHRAGE